MKARAHSDPAASDGHDVNEPNRCEVTLLVRADGNNNVRLALPVAALQAAGVEPTGHRVVLGASSRPGHLEVTISAAGARYLADLAGLPPDPDVWPESISGIARVVAGAVPYATARIAAERHNGQRRRVAIYSGDLARSQAEPLHETHRLYGGSSAHSTAEPGVYEGLAPTIGTS